MRCRFSHDTRRFSVSYRVLPPSGVLSYYVWRRCRPPSADTRRYPVILAMCLGDSCLKCSFFDLSLWKWRWHREEHCHLTVWTPVSEHQTTFQSIKVIFPLSVFLKIKRRGRRKRLTIPFRNGPIMIKPVARSCHKAILAIFTWTLDLLVGPVWDFFEYTKLY